MVVPVARLDTVLREATGRAARDAAVSLDEWEAGHHARIDAILRDMGMDVTDNVPNDPADPA